MTNLDAILAIVDKLANGDRAQATSMLIGALTIMCGQSSDPIATLQVSIDSLSQARDLCVAKVKELTVVQS